MNVNYKFDIYEKLVEMMGLLYFVMGILATYSWSCKELDFRSDNNDILIFWEPLAGITGLLNIANVAIIIFFIWNGRKYQSIRNENLNALFYFICIPAFVTTIIYMIMGFFQESYNIKTNGAFSLLMVFGEFCLFCAAMILIVHIDFFNRLRPNTVQKINKKFVIFVTSIGLVNYFLFHFTAIQIHRFVETASNSSDYAQFYNRSRRSNEIDSGISFHKVRNYMQPIVILFCFISFIYLMLQGSSNVSTIGYNELNNSMNSEMQSQRNTNKADSSLIRLHPLSLILGILFLTLSLLVIVIVNTLVKSESYYLWGMYTFIFYPIPVYFFSIFLLCIQIYEMRNWEKLEKRKNMIDKILLWIGATGQIIVSLAQIKYFYFLSTTSLVSIMTRVEYTILIVQTTAQTVAVSLALDRQWMTPSLKSWHSRFFPPVGLLSINAAFMLFSVYVVKISAMKPDYEMNSRNQLFIQLFGTGLISLGETLAVLQRLHSMLIFGKLIFTSYHSPEPLTK